VERSLTVTAGNAIGAASTPRGQTSALRDETRACRAAANIGDAVRRCSMTRRLLRASMQAGGRAGAGVCERSARAGRGGRWIWTAKRLPAATCRKRQIMHDAAGRRRWRWTAAAAGSYGGRQAGVRGVWWCRIRRRGAQEDSDGAEKQLALLKVPVSSTRLPVPFSPLQRLGKAWPMA
jgi:hypothetical protein